MRFGDRLLALLGERDLSGARLARMVGVHEDTVYAWINDLREPKLRTAERVAHALGITLDELVRGVRW